MISRRRFLQAAPALPVLVFLSNRFTFHAYSLRSKVGPWVGWLEDRSGEVVAFISKSGRVQWGPWK